eukprot:Polyplicarium_translucidae@DN2517_c0_g1_i2.p1
MSSLESNGPHVPHISKAEAVRVIHWFKQLISVIIGSAFGLVPVTGYWGFVGYASLYFGLTLSYTSRLGVPDVLMDLSEAVQEGMVPAFATFMLSWVVTFTFARN